MAARKFGVAGVVMVWGISLVLTPFLQSGPAVTSAVFQAWSASRGVAEEFCYPLVTRFKSSRQRNVFRRLHDAQLVGFGGTGLLLLGVPFFGPLFWFPLCHAAGG